MRTTLTSLAALALATTATPAFAQDQTDPAPAVTVSGSATIISDYRFRGISQTDRDFAVQAGVTVSHDSGFYAGVWGSTVDKYVTLHGTAHQEIDLIAGYRKSFDGITLDAGAIYYLYPGKRPGFPGDVSASNFVEPYASLAYAIGPATAKVSVAYAPKQKALSLDQGQSGLLPKRDNVYLSADLSSSIPNTPVSITAHVGHTFGPSWLSIGKEYTDWSLGASYNYRMLTFGVSYVDTDGVFLTPSGRNAAKGTILGSIGVAF